MSKHNNYIAFFDLDRTLIHTNSGEVFIKQAYKKGYIKLVKLLYAYYLSMLYNLRIKKPISILIEMGNWLAGFSKQEISDFCNKVFEHYLKSKIHNEAFNEIDNHKQKNAEIVMLTSSLSDICEPIADYLKFDHVICSRMEVEHGIFTGKIIESFCYKEVKLIQLQSFCNAHEISLSDVYYYGDSMADLPVLKAVGHPVCVNPDKKLRKIAHKQNWTIKHWK